MAKKSKKGKEPKGLKAWRLGKKRAKKKKTSGTKKRKKRMSGPKKGTHKKKPTRGPNYVVKHDVYKKVGRKKKRKAKKTMRGPAKRKKRTSGRGMAGLAMGNGAFSQVHKHFVG